jgi:hypothetical protein
MKKVKKKLLQQKNIFVLQKYFFICYYELHNFTTKYAIEQTLLPDTDENISI